MEPAFRDYVHVSNLAAAHAAALKADLTPGAFEPVNVGTGEGYSVAEVVATVEQAVAKSDPAQHRSAPRGGSSKPGSQIRAEPTSS